MEKKGVEDINEDDVNKAQDNLGERSKILVQHNLAVFAVLCAGLSVETIPRTDYSLFTSSSEDSEANDEATVDPEL